MPGGIHPFRIAVSRDAIEDLRRRLAATRWPTAIAGSGAGSGWAMGMDTTYLRWLADQWLNHFDWRAIETSLNDYPQFMATIGSSPIHFVHLRGNGPSPIPIILTHGWPSTYAELLRLGRVLADPSDNGHGGAPSFDVVIPSLPGYGFSPCRVVTSWTSHALPSGSLKAKNDP